jgi:hypothetical protein
MARRGDHLARAVPVPVHQLELWRGRHRRMSDYFLGAAVGDDGGCDAMTGAREQG